VQYGAVGALAGSQQAVQDFKQELLQRRTLFYDGVKNAAPGVFSGAPPAGAFYAFLKIDPAWRSPLPDAPASQSWAMTEFLIKKGRIGCVPGADFGSVREGYVRLFLRAIARKSTARWVITGMPLVNFDLVTNSSVATCLPPSARIVSPYEV
jgi:aspartate/methionine/tyrosine aminotransferase